MALIESTPCPVCTQPFTPQRRARGTLTQTCGTPSCRGKWAARTGRISNVAAIAAVQKKARARVFDATWAKFGELSEREAAIFRFGHDEGYQMGQNAVRRKAS